MRAYVSSRPTLNPSWPCPEVGIKQLHIEQLHDNKPLVRRTIYHSHVWSPVLLVGSTNLTYDQAVAEDNLAMQQPIGRRWYSSGGGAGQPSQHVRASFYLLSLHPNTNWLSGYLLQELWTTNSKSIRGVTYMLSSHLLGVEGTGKRRHHSSKLEKYLISEPCLRSLIRSFWTI